MKQITYLITTLGKDEEILKIAELHWINYLKPVLLFIIGLSTVALFGIGIIFLIWGTISLLDKLKREFVITNKRVIAKIGIIAVKTSEIRLPKIESVCLKQTIPGRIFGYSDIVFSGTGTSYTCFTYIKDPVLTKTMFEEIIENNKKD